MAFVLDDERRVRDPERNLALVLKSSEKEGGHDFVLTGPQGQVGFFGRKQVARIEGADPDLPAPLRTLVTWRISLGKGAILAGWTREETEQAIAEAMTVWKFAHGGPPGQLVEVEFT